MSGPDHAIPEDRLPPGFAKSLERERTGVATPHPAATIALLRDGGPGLEVLLLRRARSAGFVPGAWVFPGGRVDRQDAGPEVLERLLGLTPADAARRLGTADGSDPPAVAYYVAALREAFEETGILVARDSSGTAPPSSAEDAEVRRLRLRLMEDQDAFSSVLDRLGCRMDGAAMEYIAHWITPEAEPRRYDTRFFAAVVSAGAAVLPDGRETTRARWIAPEDAILRNRRGELPMVFPTLRTLDSLAGFQTAAAVLDAFRGRRIAAVLPRLVRTPTGVAIEADEEEGSA